MAKEQMDKLKKQIDATKAENAIKELAFQCAIKGIDVEKSILPMIEWMESLLEVIEELADKNEKALLAYFNQK